MKAKTKPVRAGASQLVLNHPAAFLLVKLNRASMRHGFRQARVPAMLGNGDVAFEVASPADHARARFITDDKGRLLAGSVLLDTIDLDGGMISGRAKQMPRFQISRVNVGPGIDDVCGSASRDFDRESVVVAVRAATADSGAAPVKEQKQIVLAKHVASGIAKGPRP